MRRLRTCFLVPLLALAVPALAGDAPPPHLGWRHSYAEALLEARVRNVPVLLIRHRDECGRCKRQRRQVLTHTPFVVWANAHLISLVAHNDAGHEAGEKGRCPLYPGITCRDHRDAAVDVEDERDEDLVPVPFVELSPNTWLVTPAGKVLRVPEKDQFDPKRIRKQVEEVQTSLGEALDVATWKRIRPLLEKAESAHDEASWRAVLEALAAAAALAGEPAKSFVTLLDARLALLDEDVALASEDVLEADEVTDEARALVAALIQATDVEVLGRRLPIRARLVRWLAARK